MADKKKKKLKIDRNITFADLVKNYPEAGMVLMEKGMHCVGCPMAMQETLEEGCKAHGMNKKEIDKLVKELNK